MSGYYGERGGGGVRLTAGARRQVRGWFEKVTAQYDALARKHGAISAAPPTSALLKGTPHTPAPGPRLWRRAAGRRSSPANGSNGAGHVKALYPEKDLWDALGSAGSCRAHASAAWASTAPFASRSFASFASQVPCPGPISTG